jgi:3,4-dihydroxyphthalate decarboxylase
LSDHSEGKSFPAERRLISDACRVLAARGLADGILGHISLRVGTGATMLIRCRGPHERGLGYTEPSDIHLVTTDGRAAEPGELEGGWTVPNELPLHAAVLRRRDDVHAVVHAHPPAVVAADLAGLGLRPIIGAFDIPGTMLARGGIPVFPRGVLIHSAPLGDEMVDALATRPAVVLRGHGLTSTGSGVEEAVLRAISINRLAQLELAVAAAGGTLQDLPESDFAELPDLGQTFNTATAWRHELTHLASAVPVRAS